MRAGPRKECCGFALVLLSAVGLAQEGAPSLFSEDRELVLEYLQGHQIPEVRPPIFINEANPSGDAFQRSQEKERQLTRALDLFSSGDTLMRLSVARAITSYSGLNDKGSLFWDACGPNDYEARHFILMGLALEQTYLEKARLWMLEDAHPSLAEPLLRVICMTSVLTDGLNGEEQGKALVLLRALYRQPGSMTLFRPSPGVPSYHEDSGPVAKYVIRGLARLGTKDALDQLIEWMVADGKKVENSVRVEMWSSLGRFALPHSGSRRLQDAQFVRSLAQRSEIAELFALTKRPWSLPPTADDRSREGMLLISGELRHDPVHARLFKRALIAEFANPDADVVRGVVRYVMSRVDDSELLGFIRASDLSAHARQKACEAIELTTADDLGVENMSERKLAVRKHVVSRALRKEP